MPLRRGTTKTFGLDCALNSGENGVLRPFSEWLICTTAYSTHPSLRVKTTETGNSRSESDRLKVISSEKDLVNRETMELDYTGGDTPHSVLYTDIS